MDRQALRVREYYEGNTRWMLARGVGRGEMVIHRPVWLPGTRSRRQAVRSVDRLIAERLSAHLAPAGGLPRVLDLGCGAGATAVWLAERLPVRLLGVTLSPLQALAARALAVERGVEARCRFLEGDFFELPPARGRVAAAYAVEAFGHVEDRERFFARAADLLAPGGLLLLCDDFRADGGQGAPPPGSRRSRWLEAFRRGWRFGPLTSEEEAVAAAARRGFALTERVDLTPFLKLEARRARVSHALLRALPGDGPWLSSKRGGAALQVCLEQGWVRYFLLVFRKSS